MREKSLKEELTYMFIEVVEYKKLFHPRDWWVYTTYYLISSSGGGVVRQFCVVVGELCRRSLIKNLAKCTCCISYHSNFLQIAFHLHIQPDCKSMPLSQGFPPEKDIMSCFGYRISFTFHIFNFSLKKVSIFTNTNYLEVC